MNKQSNEPCLIKQYPDLLEEWDYSKNVIDPFNLTIKKSTKIWWKCQQKHSWEAVFSSRIRGKGCPYCSNQKVLIGFNDLETRYPDVAKLWHPAKNNNRKPSEVLAGGNKSFWWLGKCGHAWESSVWKAIKGKGCSYCSGRAILQGFNDLETLYPELLSEWDYAINDNKPNQYRPGSGVKVWWKCKNYNHSWEASIEARVKGSGCLYCSNQKVLKGFNDLATRMPSIVAKYWDHDKNILSPSEVMPSSNKKAWWKCSVGHSYDNWIRNVVVLKQRCSYCTNKKLLKGFNDLEYKSPEIAAEWNYEKNSCNPYEIVYGSSKTVWWKCLKHQHEWQNTVVKRTRRGDSCPYCSNQKLLKGFNDLESQYPELIDEWDYQKNSIQPSEILSGSHTKVHWVCKKGHNWRAIPYSRTVGKSNCKKCSRAVSLNEKELQDFVEQSLKCEVSYNRRNIIPPFELDIYIPQLKIAIEYNGDYWHSNQVLLKKKGMSASEYHQNKINKCKNQDIELYFVWDSDWTSKKAFIKKVLLDLLNNENEHQILKKLNGIKD